MSEATGQPWPENTYRLRVGDVEFDLRFRSVHRNGTVHELNQRCFDLLLLFLREPQVLHTRDEIFRRVWSGVVVEDANITTTIWVLRKALGEEAKGWIRTVAKKGYVFDPPGPLEPVTVNDAAGPDPLLPGAPADVWPALADDGVPVVEAAQQVPSRRRIYLRLFAAMALLAVVLAAIHAWPQPHQSSGRVMLVAVPDASLVKGASWPVDLLRYWTDWQLRSRSDLIVVADPSAKREANDVVVLLSVVMPVEHDGEWRVRAHFLGADLTTDIDKASTAERVIEIIDEVSREIITHFAPDMSAAQLPTLTGLNSTVAPILVDAVAAEQRGLWNEAVLLYQKILETTPDFGFVRLHLAQSLAQLGQSNAAQAQLARADAWIATLPPTLQPPLNAHALGIRQDYVGAAAAFGALWKNSIGERLDWRLAEASNLRKAGRSRDALERLDGAMPDAPAQALPWLIELTEVELANRDLAHARISANDAITLARKLGWDRERALATLLLIDSMTFSGEQADVALYTDAIAAFERTGDRLGALRAQVGMELRESSESEKAAPVEHLQQLLAEARAAGNVTVESEALRRAALYYFGTGDMNAANERFDQALAVAEAAGDRYLIRLVDQHLLRQDSERGDLAAVGRRLESLRGEELQGSMAFWVGLASARLHYRRGEYEEVLAVISKTEDQLRATKARSLPQIAVGMSCMRATVFGHLGRMADAATALQACRSPEMPYFNKFADISEVEKDLLVGDFTAARRQMADLVNLVAQEKVRPERWSLAVNIAYLLARLGESEQARQMLVAVLPEIERSGKRQTEADSRTILAQIALAQGDIAEAQRQADAAGKLDALEDWLGQSRLRAVRIVIALSRGETARARSELSSLHDDALQRGDMLTELLTHSLAQGTLDQLCSTDRHAKLIAQSGLRGVSLDWMMPPSLRATGTAPRN